MNLPGDDGENGESLELNTELEADDTLEAEEQLTLSDEDEALPWLEEDEDYEEEGSDYRILIFAGIAVLGLIGILLGANYLLDNGSDSENAIADGSTIEAPAVPYKSRPLDAGGTEVAGTGDVSFQVGEGQASEGQVADGNPASSQFGRGSDTDGASSAVAANGFGRSASAASIAAVAAGVRATPAIAASSGSGDGSAEGGSDAGSTSASGSALASAGSGNAGSSNDGSGSGASSANGGSASASSSDSTSGNSSANSSGGVGVQVGAFQTNASAERGWNVLRGQFSALQGLNHRIIEGTADSGVIFRLQAVAANGDAADTVCRSIRDAGGDCQVKR